MHFGFPVVDMVSHILAKSRMAVNYFISTTQPILIGLLEGNRNDDPTMISVPDGGGTWHDLFCLISGFLISSPPDIPREFKKSTAPKYSTDRWIAIVLPVTFISPIPIPKSTFEPESYNHLSPVSSLREMKLSVQEEEKVRNGKVKVASKERKISLLKRIREGGVMILKRWNQNRIKSSTT